MAKKQVKADSNILKKGRDKEFYQISINFSLWPSQIDNVDTSRPIEIEGILKLKTDPVKGTISNIFLVTKKSDDVIVKNVEIKDDNTSK